MKKQHIHAAIESSTLTRAQKRIMKMMVHSGHDLISFGVGTIAKRLNLSDRTVQRAFDRLQKAGVMAVVHAESLGRFPRVYKLDFDALTGDKLGDKCHRPSLLGDIVTAKCHRIYRGTSSCVCEDAKQPPSQGELLPKASVHSIATAMAKRDAAKTDPLGRGIEVAAL